jgi:hypothetical protein
MNEASEKDKEIIAASECASVEKLEELQLHELKLKRASPKKLK